jgi:hypothetical protein
MVEPVKEVNAALKFEINLDKSSRVISLSNLWYRTQYIKKISSFLGASYEH